MEYLRENEAGTSLTNSPVSDEQMQKTPRCFRQVGHPDMAEQVYLEDYVQSYLIHTCEDRLEEGCFLALFGSVAEDAVRSWYINGAALLELSADTILELSGESLDEEIRRVHGQFFPEECFVGWLFQAPAFLLGAGTDYDTYLNSWFGTQTLCAVSYSIYDNHLVTQLYSNGHLRLLEGYYIYYERNLAMQEYMVEHQWNQREKEPGDRMAEAIRNRFRQPHGETLNNKLTQCLKNGKECLQENLQQMVKPVRKWSALSVITLVTGIVFVVLLITFIYSQYEHMDEVSEAVRLFTKGILAKK